MLLAIVGDTHSKHNEFIVRRLQELRPDILCFTGDKYPDGQDLAQQLKVPLWGVIGNCDWLTSGPEELIQPWQQLTIFITHGHKYGVKSGVNRIFFRAQELGAQIVMFGHTHVPFLETHAGIILINPGSPTQPRAGVASIATLEIKNDEICASLLDVVTGETFKYINCALNEIIDSK